VPRVVIVEDQDTHARQLESLLLNYQKNVPELNFEIRIYSNPYRFLAEYACDADLIFMDIQMPEMDGITAARRVREVDPKVMLIFTTALAQYAIAGYEVQAFDYLLKPLAPEMFFSKLARALRVLDYSLEEKWIDISTKTENRRIRVQLVAYIEVADHDIVIHTKDQTYRHWGSLREYEQKLEGLHFARCSSSYLVNMKHVSGIRSDSVLVGEAVLPISRAKRKDFLTEFAKYKGGSR